jgi:hypothetical protein
MSALDQAKLLHHRVTDFERVALALDSDRFLASNGSWTARDIVAHLIGWNRLMIDGCRSLRARELPAYDEDPGVDFGNVNAALIREYDTVDRGALLAELRTSSNELAAFLRSVDPADWDRDFGVRHADEALTMRGTVDELLADYEVHERQLSSWPV